MDTEIKDDLSEKYLTIPSGTTIAAGAMITIPWENGVDNYNISGCVPYFNAGNQLLVVAGFSGSGLYLRNIGSTQIVTSTKWLVKCSTFII